MLRKLWGKTYQSCHGNQGQSAKIARRVGGAGLGGTLGRIRTLACLPRNVSLGEALSERGDTMVRLIVYPGSAKASELCLPSGMYSLGRGEEADIRIDDESLSPLHCELTVDVTTVLFRSLEENGGGISLEGRPTTEGQLEPGQTLLVGAVPIALDHPAAPPEPSVEDSFPWQDNSSGSFFDDQADSPAKGPRPTPNIPPRTAPGGPLPIPRPASDGLGPSIGRLVRRVPKLILFGLLGAAGAASGCLAGGPLLLSIKPHATPLLVVQRIYVEGPPEPATIVALSIWTALLAFFLSLLLVIGQNALLRRKWLNTPQLFGLLRRSIFVAFASACACQYLAVWGLGKMFGPADPDARGAGQIAAWMLLGGLLSWGMGAVVPGLAHKTTAVAGTFGGGAACSVMVLALLGPHEEPNARLLGVAVLGLYIGLMVIWVERSAREAALVVHWADDESTTINLGPEPVVLGSSDRAHIFVSELYGFPPEAVLVTFKNGEVELEHRVTHTRQTLKNGSMVQIGDIRLEIQTDC